MTTMVRPPRRRDKTPDSHDFATRDYDLVKEFVIALIVIGALTVGLAAVFSSPDRQPITLASWAQQAPEDVVATATAELAGTSGSATYGAPYNTGSEGQKLGPLSLQKWFGVQIPVDSAVDLVVKPLQSLTGDAPVVAALQTWLGAGTDQQVKWASAYADALAAEPDGNPAKVAAGDYGPVPVMATKFLTLAESGGLESQLTGSDSFYSTDQTKPMLLLADGAYLEEQAVAEHLGGDQWGMMNESGNYPGQPWMWLYTFWYQIKPFSTSDNADALVWGLMMVLMLGFILVPFIPGLRSLPKHLGVHKLIWRR